MVSPLTLLTLVDNLTTREDDGEQAENRTRTDGGQRGRQSREPSGEGIDRLIDIHERNQPSPEAGQAYFSATAELGANGGNVEVTITPGKGTDLVVDNIRFDRRTNHDYEFVIGGRKFSEAHEFNAQPPIRLQHGDTVTAYAQNNDSNDSEIDFELEAWEEPR